MKQRIRAAAKALLGRNAFPELNTDKKELIDFACERLGMNSFADLGAIWNVDGGYTFYAMERHRIKNAFTVDTDFTPPFLEKQKKHPGLKIIQGNFGDRSVLERICEVDGVFFFDTLLHQVRPDWDEILQMYARVAKHFLIFNQQYTNFSSTTRLLDLGTDAYFRNIPHSRDEEPYKSCFQNLEAIHPQHGRPYRDIHNIWQWGIVDTDLIRCVNSLGFRMQFYKNCGQFGQLTNVENHAFIFSRTRDAV
ncbi:MAG: hypothetical protein ABSG23_16285 [Terriglobales bacterium]|jgi:hypothetical protein